MHSFQWLSNIPPCICTKLSYPFICGWTSRLLKCPGYYKQCCDEYWGTRVSFSLSLFLDLFIYFTLQHCIGFAIYWLESAMGVHVFPILTPLPTPSTSHPSGLSQCTSSEHPVSCIIPGLAICFTYDHLHVSMPFPHIIPPSPSPTESKRLFNTSLSLLLSCIQGYHYNLSKFHMYALVYCNGVFLSGLLHSV